MAWGTQGVHLIEAERLRQIHEEGWTPEHDDLHRGGEMVRAAIRYAQLAVVQNGPAPGSTPEDWPFETEAWKPTDDPVRNLMKAGALIAAEIDRILRGIDQATQARRAAHALETEM